MFNLPNGKVTVAQILLPVSLVAFVLFLLLAFEFTQVMRDRSAMRQAMAQQDKPVEEVQRVQTQLNALAIGTQKLADNGDSNAKGIIERMNKLGITVKMPPLGGAVAPSDEEGAAAAAAPAAPTGKKPKAPPGNR